MNASVAAPLPSPDQPAFVALGRLFAVIAADLRRKLADYGTRRMVAGPLLLLIWSRIGRAAWRLEWLVARLAAGGRAVRRPGVRRPGKRAAVLRHPAEAWRDLRLPTGFGWLIRLVQETAQLRGQVEGVLADPAMAALLAADPQVGRVLRPICRMLAITPGPGLAVARRRRVRRAAPAAEVAAEAVTAERIPPKRWPWVLPARRKRMLRRGAAGPVASAERTGPLPDTG